MAELGLLRLVSYLSINTERINNYLLEEGIDLSDLRCLSGLSYIENSGNYVAFSPEFSNGQSSRTKFLNAPRIKSRILDVLKTSNTINRIVHIKGGEKNGY